MEDAPEETAVPKAQDGGGYLVLARKYRPASFADLIGQEPMVKTLRNAFATGRIAQAYMLTGVRGVGKTTTARILARALNYERADAGGSEAEAGPTLDLSTPGVHCRDIMEGRHVDVVEMDAASHTGIDDIREIIASVRYKPVSARYKVYIIDEVHMLSKAAFNGLLKTLEEPPPHVKFVFATTEIRKVPITVLSRCQRFDLRRIEPAELTAHLADIAGREGIEADEAALALIARAGEGSVRDALSLLDQAIARAFGAGGGRVEADDVRAMLGLADRGRVIDLFEVLMRGEVGAALDRMKAQYDDGAEPATVIADLASFVHFVTRVRYVDGAADDPSLSPVERDRGRALAKELSPRVLGRAWQMLLKGLAEVQSAPRPLAAADMVLVRIAHAADMPSPEDALKALADGTPLPAAAPLATDGGDSASAPAPVPAPQATAATPDGPRMARVAGAPALVMENAAPQAAETRPAPQLRVVEEAEAEAAPTIATLDDLLAEAERRRDIRFKLMLRNNLSPVVFEEGRIEFVPVGSAPSDMARQIGTKLREWTGTPWQVVAREDGGADTLEQVAEAEKAARFSSAEEDPVVQAVLRTFPDARIVDVTIRGGEEPVEETAAAAAAHEDGPPMEDGDPGSSGLDDYF